jgi:hypothetical protein
MVASGIGWSFCGTLSGGASPLTPGSGVVGVVSGVDVGGVAGSPGTVVSGSVVGVVSDDVAGVESGVLGGVWAAAGAAVPTTTAAVIRSARNRPMSLILSVAEVSV